MIRLAALLLLLLTGLAHAQVGQMAVVVQPPPAAPAGYTGIGDVQAMTVYYSCTWAYTAAYATGHGKLCNMVRASDSETCDILADATTGGQGVTGNCSGADNGQTLATWLTSTTGTVKTAYNQVANGTLDATQATVANQPPANLGCFGSLMCLSSTAFAMQLQTTNTTPTNGTGTLIAYANRASGTNVGNFINDNTNGGIGSIHGTTGTSNKVTLQSVTGTFATSGACNDAAWHALVGAVNGASSVLSCDGAETTGTATGNTTAGRITAFSGGSTGTTEWIESGLLDGTPLGATARAALIANMQARN